MDNEKQLEKNKFGTVKDGLDLVKKLGLKMTKPTLIKILRKGIGRQPNGPRGRWIVNLTKLERYLT